MAQKDKELGFLITKTFKEYFEENERKWNGIMKGLKDYIDTMRKQREYLLCKFKPSSTLDFKKVMQCKDVSLENLIEHKTMIEKMIGEYYNLEDKHFSENFKRRHFEKEVYEIIPNWDRMRCSDRVKRDLADIDTSTIEEQLKFTDEYKK